MDDLSNLNALDLHNKARNSEELKFHLTKVTEGDTILLSEGTFLGPFLVSCHDLTIRGQSRDTSILTVGANPNQDPNSIQSIFESSFNRTSLIDLTILLPQTVLPLVGASLNGENPSLRNVRIIGVSQSTSSIVDERTCIFVKGTSGTFSNLELENIGKGIEFNSGSHKVNDIILRSISDYGIFLSELSSQVSIARVHCQDVPTGVLVQGNNCTLKDMLYMKSHSYEFGSVAIRIGGGGCENVFENVTCEWSNCLEVEDIGFEIHKGWVPESSRNLFKNCSFGASCYVGGSKNSLENVLCGTFLRVEGGGHVLVDVSGETLVLKHQEAEDTELRRCRFKTIKKDIKDEDVKVGDNLEFNIFDYDFEEDFEEGLDEVGQDIEAQIDPNPE